MPVTRRRLLATAAAVVLGSACERSAANPISSSAPTPSSPSSSQTPAPKLTEPGEARKVISQLYEKAGSRPVVKIDITADQATLATIIDEKPHTWQWQQGTINEIPSNVENIKQATFDPASYKFDDLTRLFGLAGALSGSTSNQELQIVEHTEGQVLMVVVTRPETRPIFFRPDGSPIHELDYALVTDMTEGLKDALGGRTQLSAVGYDPGIGLWAEAPDPDHPGIIVRRTRKDTLPTWISQSKGSAPTLFSAADLSAQVLSSNLAALPKQHGKPDDATVKFLINMQDKRNLPTIHWDVGGVSVITDLQGADVTSQIDS